MHLNKIKNIIYLYMTYYFIIIILFIILFILFLVNLRKNIVDKTKNDLNMNNIALEEEMLLDEIISSSLSHNSGKTSSILDMNDFIKKSKYVNPNSFTNISNKMILSHIMDDNSSTIANKGSVNGDDTVIGIDESPDYYDIKNKNSDGTNNLHQKINKSSLRVIKNAVGPIKEEKQTNLYLIPEQLNECQVPTLNTQQCYKSRNYECPIVNGSYLQCTNNYIPSPKHYNADCGNRTFDMVPYPWKISENCYYNKIGFNRNKKYDKVKYV